MPTKGEKLEVKDGIDVVIGKDRFAVKRVWSF